MQLNEKQKKDYRLWVASKLDESQIKDVISLISESGIDYVNKENLAGFLTAGGVLLLAQIENKIIGCIGIITDGFHVHIMLMSAHKEYKNTVLVDTMVKNAEKLIRDNLKEYDRILIWANINAQNMIQIFDSRYEDYSVPVKFYFKKVRRN